MLQKLHYDLPFKKVTYDEEEDRKVFECMATLASKHFLVSRKEIVANTRGFSHIAYVRMGIMFLIHVEMCWDMTRTGKAVGRDRTTVSYACKRIFDLVDHDDPQTYDEGFRNKLDAVFAEYNYLVEQRTSQDVILNEVAA